MHSCCYISVLLAFCSLSIARLHSDVSRQYSAQDLMATAIESLNRETTGGNYTIQKVDWRGMKSIEVHPLSIGIESIRTGQMIQLNFQTDLHHSHRKWQALQPPSGDMMYPKQEMVALQEHTPGVIDPLGSIYPITRGVGLPLQLAGPLHLVMDKPTTLSMQLPFDVDAGVLKRVTLLPGVTVEVVGALAAYLDDPVDLRNHAEDFPQTNFSISKTSSLLQSLSDSLRESHASSSSSLLTVHLVAPTGIRSTSSPSYDASPTPRFKVHRVGKYAIEIRPRSFSSSNASLQYAGDSFSISSLNIGEPSWLWPLPSLLLESETAGAIDSLLRAALQVDDDEAQSPEINIRYVYYKAVKYIRFEVLLEKKAIPVVADVNEEESKWDFTFAVDMGTGKARSMGLSQAEENSLDLKQAKIITSTTSYTGASIFGNETYSEYGVDLGSPYPDIVKFTELSQ